MGTYSAHGMSPVNQGAVYGGRVNYNIDKTTTPNITYIGISMLGVADSDPAWKIIRIDKTATVIKIRHAEGNEEFNHIWNDRATTISYS